VAAAIIAAIAAATMRETALRTSTGPSTVSQAPPRPHGAPTPS
jgi:hypothetical protein